MREQGVDGGGLSCSQNWGIGSEVGEGARRSPANPPQASREIEFSPLSPVTASQRAVRVMTV